MPQYCQSHSNTSCVPDSTFAQQIFPQSSPVPGLMIKSMPNVTKTLSSAGLLVMHAHAADPLQAYGELFKSAPLPPLMRQGIMEPAILKHYLLLHDDAAVSGGLARSAFFNACSLSGQVPARCQHLQSTISQLVATAHYRMHARAHHRL